MEFKPTTDEQGEEHYTVHCDDKVFHGNLYRDGNGSWYWYPVGSKVYAPVASLIGLKLDELNKVVKSG